MTASSLPDVSPSSRLRSAGQSSANMLEACRELALILQNDSPLPLYRQVSEQIKDWIEAGRLQPGEQLVSERNMSTMLNISRRTVRAALSDLIAGNYVSATHGCGNFVLTPPKTREIRILALERFQKELTLATPRHHDLIHEAEQRLNVSVHYKYVPSVESFRALLKSPPSGYHGILLCRPPQDWIDQISHGKPSFVMDIPLLVCGRVMSDSPFHYVSADHRGQGYAATQRLIALGHRRIGYISGMLTHEHMQSARQGYLAALRDAGITPHEEDELTLAFNDRAELAQPIGDFLKARKFTAVVVAGSAFSSTFEDAVQRAAVHIPRELSVVLVTEQNVLDELAMRWTAILYPDEVIERSLEILGAVAIAPPAERVQEVVPFHESAGATCRAI